MRNLPIPTSCYPDHHAVSFDNQWLTLHDLGDGWTAQAVLGIAIIYVTFVSHLIALYDDGKAIYVVSPTKYCRTSTKI